MPNSGKPANTTIDEFVDFARTLREMGATFVKVGALEAKFAEPAAPVFGSIAQVENGNALEDSDERPIPRYIEPLSDSERGELDDLRRLRDQQEELS